MGLLYYTAHFVLWGSIAVLGLVMWGTFRALRLLSWRLDQWELASPRRRRGIGVGSPAPRFGLTAPERGRVRLRHFAGTKVLLVFADDARDLLPDLRLLQRPGDLQVLLVQNAARSEAAGIMVLRQKEGRLSRRYRVLETPFAFVIDERGRIAAKGLVRNGRHLHFLLDAARSWAESGPAEEPRAESEAAPSVARLRNFRPRPDDIFVVTYPRSGTTWTQMILYQLTTDGRMDFAHITQVCPWFERAFKAGHDLDALPGPRVFKSHLTYRRIPKGPCKYLYVARDGKDVAVSYYHFHRSHMDYQGTFDEFFAKFLAGELSYGSWLRHVEGWWAHRADGNVLFLHYEDMVHDLPGSLRRIARFCELDVEPERFDSIVDRCGFAFMKAHESQFDPLLGIMWERGARPTTHLRIGRPGGWKERLSPEQEAEFDRAFGRRLERRGIGLATTTMRERGSPTSCVWFPSPDERTLI
jgi:hypothetical protein